MLASVMLSCQDCMNKLLLTCVFLIFASYIVYNTPINAEKYKYLIKQAGEKTVDAAE